MRKEKRILSLLKTFSMSFEVIATGPFERKLKKLAKKYKSLKDDLRPIIEQLAENPTSGVPLGNNCYKI